MIESEIARIRRKNHEALTSSKKRLLVCIAISLGVWAVIILGSLVTS